MIELRDPSQFAGAYRRYAPRVRAAALRVLREPGRAEDIAQEVFLRLWRNPERFDARRGDLGSYLQLMAHSRALDLWRSEAAAERATERLESRSARDAFPLEDQPDRKLDRAITQRAVRRLVGELPQPQREALALYYWADMTSGEIADHLRIPSGTAKSRLRLGHEKLRAKLAATEPSLAVAG